jgi:hypothetical protein
MRSLQQWQPLEAERLSGRERLVSMVRRAPRRREHLMGRPKVIHTLESVLARTVEVGDCLEWQGFMQDGRTPLIKVHNRLVTVRRFIRELQGTPAAPGRFLSASCGNPRCVSPDHILERTSKQHARYIASCVDMRHPVRIVKLQRMNAHKRALTDEQVEVVRNDPRSATALAREFGCSKSVICNIRNGQTYRQIAANPWDQLLRAA